MQNDPKKENKPEIKMLVAIIRSCCVKMVVAIIRLCCVELVVAIIRSCCQQQYNTWILYSNMFNIQVKAYRVQCYLSCGAFLACYSRSQIKSFYVQFHSKVSKMAWNFYHGSIVHAICTISRRAKYLNVYNHFILCSMLHGIYSHVAGSYAS